MSKMKNKIKSIKSYFLKNKKASVLAYSLIVVSVMIVIATSISVVTVIEKKGAVSTDSSVQAYQIADSGVQLAIKKINADLTKNINQVFSDCSSLDANSVKVRKETVAGISGSSYEITFRNESGIGCGSKVASVQNIKSTGEYKNTVRAVEVSINPCGPLKTVDYEGETYTAVPVGNQCWMGKNLNVGVRLANGSTLPTNEAPGTQVIQKWCYNDNPSICGSDGGLYYWDEAMGYVTTEGAQGICPSGWHIPTDAELYILENYLKDDGEPCDANRAEFTGPATQCIPAGTKMKIGGSSGLNFPLAGQLNSPTYAYRQSIASIWSSTDKNTLPDSAWHRHLNGVNPDIRAISRDNSGKKQGRSVRCVKN